MALALSKTSVTKELLKLRECSSCTDTIQAGRWYDGFTKVKTFAEANGIPLIAVWTNGDKCGFCVKLEKCFLDPEFIKWQKDSGCIFWLGTSTDTNSDDKYQGSGFKWIYQHGKVRFYPFVRIYWPKGKVDVTTTGNDLDRRLNPPKGTTAVLTQLKDLLKNWKKPAPKPAPVPPTPPAPPKPPEPAPVPAKKFKVRFNPEWTQEQIKEFQESIKKNDGHCPCQPEKTPDTKCMCKIFRVDMKDQEGICPCGLYQRYLVK